jgi:N-acyl-D-amino-acid deacylase
MYDLLVRNGRVLDGTGSPWFRADVAVVANKIGAIGILEDKQAAQEIDATGLFVAPGFVEEHSPSDVSILAGPQVQSAVRQGVRTTTVGLCSMSAAPVFSSRPGWP